MDLTVNTINKKLNKAYWAIETKVDKVFNKVAFPILIVFVVMFFTHLEYIHNGKKRDLEALPAQLQTRLHELGAQEIQLRQYADKLSKEIHPLPNEFYRERNREIRVEVNAIQKIGYQINEQISQIISQAPNKSWAYNLYVSLGLIDGKEGIR